jgi:hypothetical protein
MQYDLAACVRSPGRLNACPTWRRKLLMHIGGAGAFACELVGMGLLTQAANGPLTHVRGLQFYMTAMQYDLAPSVSAGTAAARKTGDMKSSFDMVARKK